jgi:spermidine synthase
MFCSKHHGRALILDGVIQCTEFDEFSYQEMIAFLPLCSHPCPQRVLIIGGGDGGVAREVVKHPDVKEVVQCEIDQGVLDASKKFLPGMGCGLTHPKLVLHVGDGFAFMGQHQQEFDVIITDSSDPEGNFLIKYLLCTKFKIQKLSIFLNKCYFKVLRKHCLGRVTLN